MDHIGLYCLTARSPHSLRKEFELYVGGKHMSRRQNLAVLSALVCCALAGSALYAQTSFGRISGSVTDPSGAAVPGAVVKITNTETQNARTVETDNNGLYAVTNLPVGPYTLEATQKGFQTRQLTG